MGGRRIGIIFGSGFPEVPESFMCRDVKIIEALLPGTIALHSNFHASKDHFLPTSEVNAQLHDISIIHRPRPRFNAGLTESNMVQKCARRALHVFDIPLAV
jgi:hypothetical protein